MTPQRVAQLVAVTGVAASYVRIGRPAQLGWGATNREINEPLPGDLLISKANLTATRAITIRASADTAWPWIAQMGQGRGGFYSYDLLENLVGCDIHSVERVVLEWQEIAVGHKVKFAAEVGLTVASVERGRSLVLRGAVPIGHAAAPYDFTWAFVLRGGADNTTRLLVRERYQYLRPWAGLLVEPVAAVSFVMSQKMLRGIRDRAERLALGGTHAYPDACYARAGPPQRHP